MPSRPSASPAARARARSRAENFAFPFRRIFWWGARNQNERQNFLRGRPPLAATDGGASQFRSKKFRAKFRISHQQELSEFFESDERIASRLRRKMSQDDICRAVGLDRAQMSNIEAVKGNPTLATIEKIAQALGIASDEPLK
jgi:DNA-binding XRE family transcriptional regulator